MYFHELDVGRFFLKTVRWPSDKFGLARVLAIPAENYASHTLVQKKG